METNKPDTENSAPFLAADGENRTRRAEVEDSPNHKKIFLEYDELRPQIQVLRPTRNSLTYERYE
jgi:hypothetical protein